jgi:hypothetical protein
MWGGTTGDKKICWVKWDQICLPKEKGGLGVKNLELFNLALLGKWKWRFMNDGEAVWSDMLRFRCGHIPSILLGDHLSSTSASSIWWRDVISTSWGPMENWFKTNVRSCVGNSNNIGLWKFKWYGNHPLCKLFTDLFAKETRKDAFISDRLEGNGTANT